MVRRLQGILGGSIRVVEKTGTPLARLFPLSKLWEGAKCGRQDCITCNQVGETLYPCSQRNVVYENICLLCHPGAGMKKAKLEENKMGTQSIYVGESCRSLYERGKSTGKHSGMGKLIPIF